MKNNPTKENNPIWYEKIVKSNRNPDTMEIGVG